MISSRILCAIFIVYIPNYGFSNFNQDPVNISYMHATNRSIYLFGLQQDMGLKLLNTALEESPHENIILSPHSVFQSFLILYFVTNDLPRDWSMRRFFGMPRDLDKQKIMNMYQMEKLNFILAPMKPSKYVIVSVTSYLFVSEQIIYPSFVENSLRGDLMKVDFQFDLDDARVQINNCVANSTYQHFKNLVPESLIKSTTEIMAVAAGYFKGIWLSPFSPKYTTEQIFRLSPTKNVTVSMMWQIGKFYTLNSNNVGFKIIELPYKNLEYSMIIMLPMPHNHTDISSLVRLIKPKILPYMMSVSNWIMESVEVFLPKFKIFKRMDNLKKVADKLGINEHVYNLIVHQAGIDVDEGVDLAYDYNGATSTARPTTDSTVTEHATVANSMATESTSAGHLTTDSIITDSKTTGSTISDSKTTDSTITDPTTTVDSKTTESATTDLTTADPTTTDSTTDDDPMTDDPTTNDDSMTNDPTSTSQPMRATVTKVFRCDRPFVYAVINKVHGVVVVAGVYNKPEAPDNN